MISKLSTQKSTAGRSNVANDPGSNGPQRVGQAAIARPGFLTRLARGAKSAVVNFATPAYAGGWRDTPAVQSLHAKA